MRSMNMGWVNSCGRSTEGNLSATNTAVKGVFVNVSTFSANNGLIETANVVINRVATGSINVAPGTLQIRGRGSDSAANAANGNNFSVQLTGPNGFTMPNTILQKIIVTAPAGTSGSNTYGGYSEWDTATCTSITNPSANQVVYNWGFLANTTLPWQFNTASGSNVGGVHVTFVY